MALVATCFCATLTAVQRVRASTLVPSEACGWRFDRYTLISCFHHLGKLHQLLTRVSPFLVYNAVRDMSTSLDNGNKHTYSHAKM